jgi:carboxymethylenebutenolidase
MRASYFLPAGSGIHPGVLVLHTSGGLKDADLAFARRLAENGYATLVPEFLDAYGITLVTRQEAFKEKADAIYGDLSDALRRLGSLPGVDPHALGALGFSNGGYFALWLAATNQARAGVSYYGALSAAATDPGFSRFRSVFSKTSSPVLILHGTEDETVPFAFALRLDSLLTAAGSPHRFVPYEGAGHRFDRENDDDGDLPAAVDAWKQTLRFLKQNLAATPRAPSAAGELSPTAKGMP